ncbi:unnamed protein product [Owenia fusiformis]|uniref:Uncharacterized protein n=1 Tax=Owenia fusiformis TaxID=6347 RepID=A0A8J1UA02_OWEFU|nr:unnamed protein product [Owenia fusiformis]
MAARNIADLREMICMSRLTYVDSDEEFSEDDGRLSRTFDTLSLSTSGTDSRQSSANSYGRTYSAMSPGTDSGIALNGSPEFSRGESMEFEPTPPKSRSKKKKRKHKHASNHVAENIPPKHEFPRADPLPPVGSGRNSSYSHRPSSSSSEGSTNEFKGHFTEAITNRLKQPEQKRGDFEEMLCYCDATVVASWLAQANEAVTNLTKWCHSQDNYVNFAHFWLSDFPPIQRIDIFKLEHGILLDHLGLAFAVGKESGKIRHSDLSKFLEAIYREYPTKLLRSRGEHLFLHYLDVLTSEREDSYKKLLSDVKCSTKNKQYAQLILAMRCFALASVWTAIVNFYRTLLGPDSTSIPVPLSTVAKSNPNRTRMNQAIRHGYVDVIHYLIRMGKVDPRDVDDHSRTLIFTAVMHNQPRVLQFLVQKAKPKIDVNKISDTGNSALHAAANNGNVVLVTTLLKAPGIHVDVVNPQTENATPLHLAVMHGHINVVEVLLCAKADRLAKMGDLTAIDIARDFGQEEVLQLLESDEY